MEVGGGAREVAGDAGAGKCGRGEGVGGAVVESGGVGWEGIVERCGGECGGRGERGR